MQDCRLNQTSGICNAIFARRALVTSPDEAFQATDRSPALYFANCLISTPGSARFMACFVIVILRSHLMRSVKARMTRLYTDWYPSRASRSEKTGLSIAVYRGY
jgi:hypothetical protein